MTLLSCRNIGKWFGEHQVLQDVHFDIANQERIGLVGLNGVGKTTLANIISGKLEADSGEVVHFTQNMRIGYLLQSSSYAIHTVEQWRNGLHEESVEFLEAASQIGLKKLYDWEEEQLTQLSGGERTKVALAHILTTKPDLFILDEPTNHLDFQGVEWLIAELRSHQIASIIISHDRYFLDQTVHRIIELEHGKVTNYKGNYSAYREEKQRKYESQLHQYEQRQRYEKKIEQEISQLKEWSAKGHREAGKVGKMAEMRTGIKEFHRKKAKMRDKQVKSRLKRLQKIEVECVEKPIQEPTVHIDWGQSNKRGKRVIIADRVIKQFGSRQLFGASSFYVQRGERIGIVGKNGCGKSTLVHMLCGNGTVDSGELWLSPHATISVLTQDVGDMQADQLIWEVIRERLYDRNKFVSVLSNMGLNEQLLGKKLNDLSLGEKTRFKLASIVSEKRDVLILDEPTNHLDLIYREQLEEALMSYNGTLLVVSHDRYFLEKICDRLLVFENETIQRREYGFKEYMERSTRKPAKQKQRLKITEQQMVIENELAYIIGELSRYEPTEPQYISLDQRYQELIQQKKLLNN